MAEMAIGRPLRISIDPWKGVGRGTGGTGLKAGPIPLRKGILIAPVWPGRW